MRSGRRNLLILYGDGARISRLDLPPWLVPLSGATVLLLVVAVVFVYGAYRQLHGRYTTLTHEAATVVALEQRAAQQQKVIDGVERRLRDVQSEIAAWGELHARIASSVSPGRGERPVATGVGGARPPGEAHAPLPVEIDRVYLAVNEEGERLRALDRFMARASKMLAAIPSRWPLHGRTNSEFGTRPSPWTGAPEFHPGLDIGASLGTPVRAPAPGVVIFAGRGGDYGNEVMLDHGHDITTRFGHLERISVKRGQHVERGQEIGAVGSTGRSTGPHLHYEVLVHNRSVNPRAYMWE